MTGFFLLRSSDGTIRKILTQNLDDPIWPRQIWVFLHRVFNDIYYIQAIFKAAPGFEPGDEGFADLCLTTWPCRQT
jgi:hypothetical protein